MRFAIGCVAMLVALVALIAPSRAFADEALARQHFKKGIELYDRRQYAEALAAFEDAYKEKPSPGIKQNIALCLKGLHRPVEAATAFDEALDEGKDSLKPETRAAIERELGELAKGLATVQVAVVGVDRQPIDGAIIAITPENEPARTLAPGAYRRPIRLMPGIYVLAAHASGFPDPPEKKLALVSASPVEATFVMGGQQGTISVKPTVKDAVIKVDGVEVGKDAWTGALSAGKHIVEASAPEWKPTSVEVDVPAGGSVDVPIRLLAAAQQPAEYYAAIHKAPKDRHGYVALGIGLETVSYRLSPALGEPLPSGTRRSDFGGVTASGRLGFFLPRAKVFALELLFAGGSNSATYKISPSDAQDSKTSVTHLQLTPMLRLVTTGAVRFTAGTGVGVHLLHVETSFQSAGQTVAKDGKGGTFSWLTDVGIQADLGPIFVELAGYIDVHGVGTVEADTGPETRLLLASPATRGGARASFGIQF